MLLSNCICSYLDSQRFVFEQLLQLHHYTNNVPVNIEFALWIFEKCLSFNRLSGHGNLQHYIYKINAIPFS